MKQAFHVLQLPILELSEWLQSEIESNPVLEVDLSKEEFKESLEEPFSKRHTFINKSQEDFERRRHEHQESLLTAQVSLYEHMMAQSPLIFEDPSEQHLAERIIGHLSAKGFLETPLEEIAPLVPLEKMQKILKTVQTFDPPGVGARNLKECLLLQLKYKNKENSQAAEVIAHHFDDLVHNRLPLISQRLRIPIGMLMRIVEKEIAPLDLSPGYRFGLQHAAAIIPDLSMLSIDGKWQIDVNTSFLPKFQIAPIYLQALRDHSLETQEYYYLRRQLAGGRWLKRIVCKRNHTLRSIGEFLLKKQIDFFNGDKATLLPLTMKEASEELGVHESTIARAVANKFLACPQGLLALKSLFKQGVETKSGDKISRHSMRQLLAKTISKEDKLQPLSDEQLAQHFQKQGIPCARRTIAKYRSLLKISPACKRRKWGCTPSS